MSSLSYEEQVYLSILSDGKRRDTAKILKELDIAITPASISIGYGVLTKLKKKGLVKIGWFSSAAQITDSGLSSLGRHMAK